MRFKAEYRPPRAGEVMKFLAMHATKVEPGEGLNVRFAPCPGCHRDQPGHTSNTIHSQTGLWYCWACQASGNFFTLTRAFGDPLPESDRYSDRCREARAQIDKGRAELKAKRRRRPVVDGHYPELLAYCVSRGLSPATLDAWRVSTNGPKNLRWPMYALGDDGEWHMANARLRAVIDRDAATTKDWFEISGGDTGLMLGNHLLDHGAPEQLAIITEGQWDAMSATELGFRNVFSLPSGASNVHVSRLLRYIPESWEIWLAVDMDRAGDLAAEAFYAQLGPKQLARVIMPHKDLNEWLLAKPDLSADDVRRCVRGLSPIAQQVAAAKVAADPTQRFIRFSADEDLDALADQCPIGETPWPTLTRHLGGGPRAGQTTGLLAPSGTGKTTVVNQWVIDLAAKGRRTGIVSLEGAPAAIKHTMTQAIRGYVAGKHNASDLRHNISQNMVFSKLNGASVGWKDAIAELRMMALEGHCQLAVLDNLDFIMPRDNLNVANQIKVKAYGEIVKIANETGMHIVVVWQPFKIEAGQIVNSGHQKGASQLLQDADNYINLNRIERRYARFEVEKCRAIGVQADRHTWALYNDATHCLMEIAAPPTQAAQGGAVRRLELPKLE